MITSVNEKCVNMKKGKKKRREYFHDEFFGADYEARTRYLHLGKVALYQMS